MQTLDILVVVVPPETLLNRLGRPAAGVRGPGDGGGGDLFRGLGQFVDGIRCVVLEQQLSSATGRRGGRGCQDREHRDPHPSPLILVVGVDSVQKGGGSSLDEKCS